MINELPILSSFVVGDPGWLPVAAGAAAAGILTTLWLARHRMSSLLLAVVFRVVGWLLIVGCLINPLWSSARPRRGANVMAVLTDVSRSHLVTTGADTTRADVLAETLASGERTEPGGWLTRIDQDFELQRYVFSEHLRRVESFSGAEFEQPASNLCSCRPRVRC